MKNKKLKQLIAIAMIVTTIAVTVPAINPTVVFASEVTYATEAEATTAGFTVKLSGDEYQITRYTGTGTDVTIPSQINGKNVTSIGILAFNHCSGLTSITIPSSVTRIDDYAFESCSGLTSITIPSGITSISASTFVSCSGLTSITIPSSVTRIDGSAFIGCSGLTSITIPSNVTSIGDYAFAGCSGLTSITIPSNVTSIGASAFVGCSGLTSITIPSSVKSIGSSAFDHITNEAIFHVPNDAVKQLLKEKGYPTSGTTQKIVEGSLVAAGTSNITSVTDIADNGDGRDLQVQFDKASDESLLGSYRVMAVKADKAATFDLAAANAVAADNYTTVAKTGANITQALEAGAKDTDGAVINNGQAYKVFVLSVADGTNATVNTLSGASTEITLQGGSSLPGSDVTYTDEAAATAAGFTVKLINENYQITRYSAPSGASTDITIPSQIGGKSVTSIGASAFYNCSGLTSITIPSSVTSIGDAAFNGCSGLTSINIPSGVTSIGNSAFYNCSGLISITIPSSVTSIGNVAFYSCSGLKSITIPSSVTSIGEAAFHSCNGLTSINILSGVTSIGDNAFHSCSRLTSITIPSSVTSIGNDAFDSCSGLTSITIPSSVTSIGDFMFFGCSGLTSIKLPSGVTSIGYGAFDGCSSLTSITIPSSVTSIGDSAFNGIDNGATFYVPNDAVKQLLNGRGYPTSRTTQKIVEGSLVAAGTSNITSVTDIADNGDGRDLQVQFDKASDESLLGSYRVMAVKADKAATFDLATANAVTNGNYTTVAKTGANITQALEAGAKDTDGAVINNGQAYKVFVLSVADGTNATVNTLSGASTEITLQGGSSLPGSDVTYADEAAATAAGFTVQLINGNYQITGYSAPSGASTDVKIPSQINGKNVTSIVGFAFSGCSGLTSIKIPSSVTSIGAFAFSGCIGLTSINIPSGVTSIGDGAFQYCNNLTSITIQNGVTSIGNAAFEDCSGLTTITIPSSVTSIGGGEFIRCSGLTSITIPDGITSIGENMFYGCSGLAEITIPSNVTSIGDNAFENCSGLAKITIPSNVTSIGVSVFKKCSGLKTITIPSGVTSIGDSAFDSCSGLTTITIPSGVTSIGHSAFNLCSNLKIITIPSSVTSIGGYVFDGINYEATFYVPNDEVKQLLKDQGYPESNQKVVENSSIIPILTADSTSNDTANEIDVTFTDDAVWRAAITDVTVDGASINSSKYSTATAGKIIFNAGVLSAGTHNIKVIATGYSDTTVSQTVNAAPAINNISVAAATASVKQGDTDQLTANVDAADGVDKTVTWSSSDTNNKVTVDSNGLVTVAADAASGEYTITATSTADGTKKGTATITVTAAPIAPSITTNLSDTPITVGETASFSVSASGTGLTYQWKVDKGDENGFVNVTNDSIYSGATTDTLDITGADIAMNGYRYEVIVSGTIGTPVTSAAAKLTVNEKKSNEISVTDVNKLDDINVNIGTDKSSIGLPETVDVELSNGSTTSAAVTWNSGSPTYDKDKSGTYRFTGALKLIDTILNQNRIKANVNVVVGNNTTTPAAATYDLNYTAGDGGTITGDLSQKVKSGEDGSEVVAVPNSNYYFAGWSDGKTNARRKDVNVMSDVDVMAIFKANTSTSSSSSSHSSHSTSTDQITVNVTDGSSKNAVSQTVIERTTASDGSKTDEVKYTADKAQETITALAKEGKDTVRIVATDSDNSVSKTQIDIPKDTLSELSSGKVNLEIEANGAIVSIPKESVQGLAASGQLNGDLYFRVVPIKDTTKQEAIRTTADTQAAVKAVAGNNGVQVLGTPMTIETNMGQRPVDITLPLTGINLPTDPIQRQAFLNDLGVFIEHSDGEKVLEKGTVVDYGNGTFGIKFRTTKFSDFTIVKLNQSAKAGWKLTNGSWFHLDTDAKMNTGWFKDSDGSWYFLCDGSSAGALGEMETGWKYVNGSWYFLKDNGAMATGWQEINGVWYYLSSDGSMAASTTIDGYQVDGNGAWIQ